MTSSDRQMDRELRALSTLEPAKSVWPEIEQQLARRQTRQRRRAYAGYGALAASLLVAVAGYSIHARQATESLQIQETVENAVRDARPRATFSGLELKGGDSRLEALRVSSKPRAAAIIVLERIESGKEQSERFERREINEF